MTELQEGMDMKTYMGLYTAIHNFCTAQKAVGTGTFSTHNRGGGRFPWTFVLYRAYPDGRTPFVSRHLGPKCAAKRES
jgi:hypothetical protein